MAVGHLGQVALERVLEPEEAVIPLQSPTRHPHLMRPRQRLRATRGFQSGRTMG
jgi:hypothetical protein